MPTTPPSITAAPTPAPQRSDRSTFSSRVDAFVTWIGTAVTQFGNVATNCYDNAVEAYNSSTNASTSATAASASATAAASAVNAAAWVSGNTYTTGQCAYSPIDFQTYRHITATSSLTTDPSLDTTNWVLITATSTAKLHSIALYF